MHHSANRRRIPAPSYQPGQQVMLRAKDLHFQRHPVFHVSQIKPVAESSFSPPAPTPPPPRILESGDPVWSVKEILRRISTGLSLRLPVARQEPRIRRGALSWGVHNQLLLRLHVMQDTPIHTLLLLPHTSTAVRNHQPTHLLLMTSLLIKASVSREPTLERSLCLHIPSVALEVSSAPHFSGPLWILICLPRSSTPTLDLDLWTPLSAPRTPREARSSH
ncbi:uncharacterized protein LOC133655267 [Entelurus aequoreus]|uniref:uncharacterized protein LOC133655267 n=1 Tax=Entelurus aequoreus TaxID=161455 RepID=UPI002B1DBC72|nr:uncharacterized protein LOC133655267 [Entelurus aequoreus]